MLKKKERKEISQQNAFKIIFNKYVQREFGIK